MEVMIYPGRKVTRKFLKMETITLTIFRVPKPIKVELSLASSDRKIVVMT